jgi:hypothetical protein
MPKERREVSEEREFWGFGTPGTWDDNPLLPGTGTAPDRKPFRFYPVFDSSEKAERFAREASRGAPAISEALRWSNCSITFGG